MSIITPMTELEAVNEMLMSIGQAPVSTLEVTGITDVNIARGELAKVSRRVQSQGWNFNTDEGYELSRDVDGHVRVPQNALRVDAEDPSENIIERRLEPKGRCLYSRDRRSFVFPAAVTVKIVWGFPFDELPEAARCYIATSAGRKFQSRVIGSQILDRFQQEDEMRAWVLLEREERASRDTNLFRRNASLGRYLNRTY